MKSYKIVGIMVAMFAILVASAIPSYAWQPRTRLNVFRNTCGGSTKHTLGERISTRGGILSKITGTRASCGSSAAATKFTVSSCGGSAAASCSGRSTATPSCAASVPTTASAPTPVYLAVPTAVYMESPVPTDCSNGYCTPVRNVVGAAVQTVAQSAKGSLQFAQQLAREGRMYHDRSYVGYENVASGASSPADAIRMWQNSPPHRRNLPYITDIQCVNGFCVGR